MTYKKALLALVCSIALAPIVADEPAPAKSEQTSVQAQITALDNQIKQLKDERDVAAMKAYAAGNTADQVMDQDWLGYKQALAEQTQCQERVASLDAQIAELENKKKALLPQVK